MSNHSPSLQEFAYPIPICESEVDFDEMLKIFQHLNCKMLAIPDRLGSWGVVRAEDLLSMVAETWLGDRIASSSYPSNSISQQSPACRLIPKVEISIKSAKLYQADLQLNEFLNSLTSETLFQEECLVVDRQGKLQGQLDRHKIIQYLASNRLEANAVPSDLSYSIGSIDISLPCKIETAQGKTVHTNQQWHTLERKKSLEPNLFTDDGNLDRMTKRWIESQESVQPSQLEDLNNNRDEKINLFGKVSLDSNGSLTEVKIDPESNWNYLTIPLTNSTGEIPESYNLILATPTIQNSRSPNSSQSSPNTTQILNAVSHELKSPITGIVGLSSLLEGQKLGSLNQRQVMYVKLIRRSGKKMMRVIDDLLQLNILTASNLAETELINLEFLCRQLYQTILIEVESLSNSSLTASQTQPKLSIESGCEIAIANKSLLSSILSHLMLEAINSSQNFKRLQIQISSRLGGTTAIIMTCQGTASVTNAGFNLTLAKHLAAAIGATINHSTTVDRCQLTLLLPKKIQFLHSTPNSYTPASSLEAPKKLTILCLYPELEVIDPQSSQNQDFNFDFKGDANGLSAGYQHRIIEANSIEQACNLARIWHLDAIILNGYQIARPSLYLRSLQKYKQLASLPLITLDTKTTEAANQIEGLNVFPCLLPSQCRSIEDLIQVIQIATESKRL